MNLFEWSAVAAVGFHLAVAARARHRLHKVDALGHVALAAFWTAVGIGIWVT